MNLGRVENKARIAISLFVLALLLIIALSFSLYSQARQELNVQHLNQFRIEVNLVSLVLTNPKFDINDSTLKDLLSGNGGHSQAALYDKQGNLLASSLTIEKLPRHGLTFTKDFIEQGNSLASTIKFKTESGNLLAASEIGSDKILFISTPIDGSSSYYAVSLFSYQIIALIFGIALIYLLIRWLLRPYNRMVKAAQRSPIRASTETNEGEFVVNTFQALIKQLQAKEIELERLHSLERIRAERSERFSERLIANIPSALVAVDSKGNLTSVNLQAKKLIYFHGKSTGLTDSLDLQPNAFSLDYREFFKAAPRMVEMIQSCLSTGQAYKREEVQITNVLNQKRQIGLSITPIIDTYQHIEGALCMMTDITEVTELRERIKVQETLANLGEMAAGIAHEFKNSLATIQGYAQLFESQNVANSMQLKQKTTAALIKEISLLSRLVTDFLNFARPQKLSLTQLDLGELIQDCLGEISQFLQQHRVKVKMIGSFTCISGDELLLKRAFINLIRNGVEAIDQEATIREIIIEGIIDRTDEKPYAHIKIKDSGSGISPEDLPHIFIPFFTTKTRGYGIGLAIVQKILVGHGGDVTIDKSDHQGTTFHCRLPLYKSPMVMENR
ncbi:MAG: ATP-binding protein [Acidobacteriota bacterium]